MKLNIYIFFNKNVEVLEKYNKIWKKVKNSIKKEFESEPVYNEKYLKAKIKFYNGKISTNFRNNEILKEGSTFICLLVILIDSVSRTDKNYYPLVFLEECEYVVKNMIEYNTDDIETFSDSDREDSDKENSDEEK